MRPNLFAIVIVASLGLLSYSVMEGTLSYNQAGGVAAFLTLLVIVKMWHRRKSAADRPAV